MLVFLHTNAPDILQGIIDHCKVNKLNHISIFKESTIVQCMFIIAYLAYRYKIDTYLSKMGCVSIKVTYPNDTLYKKEGDLILRKPIDIFNEKEISDYVKDLIFYLINNPY